VYDPWLEHRLRLANRRGLLTGKHLSRAQEFALDLILVSEAREQQQKMSDAFKLAVISADPGRYIPIVYPGWTSKTDEEITDKDFKESAGDWTFTEGLDKQSVEETLDDLMAFTPTTLSAEEMDFFGPP